MKKILFSALFVTTLLGMVCKAGAACPLVANSTTTWLVDTGGAKSFIVNQCQDAAPGDCSFYGVISRINHLAGECNSAELSAGTLQIKFDKGVGSVGIAKDDTVTITPPSSLRRLIIDGDQGTTKFEISGDTASTKSLLKFECAGDCSAITNFADVELKNIGLSGGQAGVFFKYGNAKSGHITVSNVWIEGSNTYGFYVYQAK